MAKILVIDDEESIGYTFESFLAEAGHEVLVARNYDEALPLLSADLDVIFSDIVLGGRTGIDLLREVKRRGLVCPIVMITGQPTVQTAAEAVRLGAFDYVPKPVVQATLLRLTQTALERKRVIVERMRNRAHLEAVLSSVGEAIITVDNDMIVRDLNPAAGDLCRLARSDMGKNLADLGLPCGDAIIRVFRETLDTAQPVKGLRLECGPGPYSRVLDVSVYPLASGGGEITGAVMTARAEASHPGPGRSAERHERFHNIIGASLVMQEVFSLIENLAGVDTTVLITGESGTGKELVAEALHRLGPRGKGPLVKVNCSALPETLLESELFGHVKGAFTGAAGDRIGRFQSAVGGTIFIDEIGDISPRVQVSLLRVLQNKIIERVGESHPIPVDVRVIAATNSDLREKIVRGQFREDLYYRLKVVEIAVPPLRDRREDIPLLIRHFMDSLNKRMNRHIRALSSDVEGLLLEYPWPGNVRELEHALEHAFVVCRQNTICLEHLPAQLKEWRGARPQTPCPVEGDDAGAIRLVLQKTAGNKAMAARMLGIDRKTLYRKMEKYGIIEEPPQ